MKELIEKVLRSAEDYQDYKKMMSALIREGKSTGITQNDRFLGYSKLNEARIKRLDKQISLSEDAKTRVKKIKKEFTWLVLTESWCGDAAHVLPVLDKFTKENPGLTLKIASRDENLELMDLFLTNGARSIPKVILMETDTLKVLSSWGPRPKPVIKIISDYKEKWGDIDDDLKKELQVWLNKDKGKSVAEEVLSLLEQA